MTNASGGHGSQQGLWLTPSYLGGMRHFLHVAVVAMCLLTACGQVEPVTMALSMPDCVYQGQNQMSEGEVSVSLSLNGITEASAVLAELTDEHTYPELEERLQETGTIPSWARPIVELDLSSSAALDGIDEQAELEPGLYALICVDDSGARVATSLVVRER